MKNKLSFTPISKNKILFSSWWCPKCPSMSFNIEKATQADIDEHNKEYHMTPTPTETWEKKIDKLFWDNQNELHPDHSWLLRQEGILREIKKLVRDTLSLQRTTLLGEIEEKIKKLKKEWDSKPPPPGFENNEDGIEMYQCGYFDGLSIILDTLSTLRKEEI